MSSCLRPRRTFVAIGACLFLLSSGVSRGQPSPEAFRSGDRWCALGDEITHHGLYHSWVELFYLTRFPGISLEAVNCGLADDTVASALKRLPWDVESRKPTVVSVLLGMNDIGRTLYTGANAGEALKRMRADRITEFGSQLRSLAARIKSTGARVILLTPTIYDETTQGSVPVQNGANQALAACARIVRDVAIETGSGLVDVYSTMLEANAAANRLDPRISVIDTNRVEPGPTGQLVMVYSILKAQAVSGVVSRLVIDLGSNAVLAADNGTVENVQRDRDRLVFRWTEKALPFPVAPEAKVAEGWIPFQEELNQQILQVAGLRDGNYELLIDAEWVRNCTAAELAGGINLAGETNTPQYRQAVELKRLVERRAELVADGLRSVVLVEHRLAPEAPRPVTMAFMEPLVNEWKAKVGADTLNTPLGRSVSLYLLRKEREDEAVASARRLLQLAELAALPRTHDFEIRRLR